MTPDTSFFGVVVTLTGILVLVTCGVWLRYDLRALPLWRRWVLAIGVVAACANVAVFVWLLFYMQPLLVSRGVYGLELWGTLASNVATPLTVVAFAGALAGQGKARVPLAILALFGLLMWIPPVVF